MKRTRRGGGQALLPGTLTRLSLHSWGWAVTAVGPEDLAYVLCLPSPPGLGTAWRTCLDSLVEAAGEKEVALPRSPPAAGGPQIPVNTAADFSATAGPRPLDDRAPPGRGAAPPWARAPELDRRLVGEGGRPLRGGVPVAQPRNRAWPAASPPSAWKSASNMILRMSKRRAAGASAAPAPATSETGRRGVQHPREGPGGLRRPIQAPTPTHASRPGRKGSQSGEAAVPLAEPRSHPPGSVPSPLPGQPPACCRLVALPAAHRPLPFHAAVSISRGGAGPPGSLTCLFPPAFHCFAASAGRNWDARCSVAISRQLPPAGPLPLGRGALSSA